MKRFLCTVIVLTIIPSAASASADDRSPTERPADRADYLFPRHGDFSAMGATGVPLLGIGELSYGVTDRFAVGAMGAATPDVGSIRGTMAFGVRPRGVLYESGTWRAVLVVPVLYYPEVAGFGGREPWFLTRPTIAVVRPGARSRLHGRSVEHVRRRSCDPDLHAHQPLRGDLVDHARSASRGRLDRRDADRRDRRRDDGALSAPFPGSWNGTAVLER
jgi:hypothetical protein